MGEHVKDRLAILIAVLLILTLILGSTFILFLSPSLSSDSVYGTTTYDFTFQYIFTNLGPAELNDVRIQLAIPRTLNGIQTLRQANILTPGYTNFQDGDGNNYVQYSTPLLTTGRNVTVRVHAVVEVYLLDFKIDSAKIGTYNTSSYPYNPYTFPGEKIESADADIIYIAQSLTANYPDFFSKARRLYDFVLQWINYQRMSPEEGALFAYNNRFGDCDEYTDLFVALARSTGIPAARVTSLFDYTDTSFQAGSTFTDASLAHAYPIFYLPNYGWISSDPTNGRNRTGTSPTAPESHWAKADGSIITMTIGQSDNPYRLVRYTHSAAETPNTHSTYEVTIHSKATQYTSLFRNLTIATIIALPLILGIIAITKSVRDLGRRRARMSEVRRLQDADIERSPDLDREF